MDPKKSPADFMLGRLEADYARTLAAVRSEPPPLSPPSSSPSQSDEEDEDEVRNNSVTCSVATLTIVEEGAGAGSGAGAMMMASDDDDGRRDEGKENSMYEALPAMDSDNDDDGEEREGNAGDNNDEWGETVTATEAVPAVAPSARPSGSFSTTAQEPMDPETIATIKEAFKGFVLPNCPPWIAKIGEQR